MSKNIYDIAEKIGVSPSTVSRALNPETRWKVAKATQKKIDAVAKQFNYTPNLAARHLRQQQTKTIGVLFPYFEGIFHNSYYVNMLSGISDFLLATEYRFKLILLRADGGDWNQYDFRVGERIDGLIVTHWPYFFDKTVAPKRKKLPIVCIDDYNKDIKMGFSCGDHFLGGKLVAEHLYDLGHRRMAVLTGLAWSSDGLSRLKGFKHFLKQKKIVVRSECILRADYQEEKAYKMVDRLLNVKPRVTAIFCCNDQMAFGVLRRLKELKIKCPEEISVVGYDDIRQAAQSWPALTTVRTPASELAKEGGRMLIEYLESNKSNKPLTQKILLPVSLITRKSTCRVD